MDGYRCTAVCFSVGPRSHDKLLKTANSIIERTRAMFKQLNLGDYTDVNLQVPYSKVLHFAAWDCNTVRLLKFD